MPIAQSRRQFLSDIAWAGVAGSTALGAAGLSAGRESQAAEPPPEITLIRLEKDPLSCIAPQAAEELLHAEGFSEIRLVEDDRPEVTNAEMLRAQRS